ncbi:hypothetical protein CkaCkLH20_10888 [Colletotrichum karsti]|uniref:Zn(2)-C6 fungal-type domain-containing protein n=1 Tax=Colletotrichum karsti TaxID=1095194 RepID=A0A9P6I4B1_9PEZI|nr:uncharacterized protein CkaCkLH20_10888 [Colletotrichum karsti]KAF9871690.1 hypothetical protein CkaCkLH20_10888 [Colletotrichum karsti]
MNRRAHKKSRNGCVECKRRHIKCDETRPTCKNCAIIERQCVYRTPPPPVVSIGEDCPGDAFRSGPSTPSRDSGCSPHDDLKGPGASSSNPARASALAHSDMPLQPSGPQVNMDHMEFLFNFRGDLIVPEMSESLRQQATELTVKAGIDAPYLMHEILSFSAMHLSHTRLDRKQYYVEQAVQLQNEAISIFNTTKPDINDSTCVAIAMFSSMLGRHLCIDALANSSSGLDAFLDSYLNFARLRQRGASVLKAARPELEGSELRPFLTWGPGEDELVGRGRDCDALQGLVSSSNLDAASKEACRRAVELVQVAYDNWERRSRERLVQMVFTWAFFVPEEFIEMLSQRRPEAAAVLGNHAVILHLVRELWQVGGSGANLLRVITEYLGPEWNDKKTAKFDQNHEQLYSMTPPRRRSARLASATNTPKPKAKQTLSSVVERDDTPPSKNVAESLNALVVPNHDPATPSSSTQLKAPLSEMHPSKVHPTVAPPSATWLGFRDMKPADKTNDTQATPSKTNGVPESPFTFRVTQPAGDSGLSNDAQQMMNELREEAARIKAELLAKRELEREDEELNGRKIAKAKGKSGRFSSAHMAEFKKMDSIEGHASAFRAQPGRVTPHKSSLKRSQSKANLDDTPTHPKSSLKRSPSKANLEDTPTHPKSILKQPSKPNLLAAGTPSQKSLKRSPSKANLDDASSNGTLKASTGHAPRARIFANLEPPSSVKRVRQRFEDDASTARPVSRDGSSLPRPKSSGNDAPTGSAPAATPSTGLRSQPSLASLTNPTKSSLARAAGSKMPLPSSLAKSPSKPDLRSLAQSSSKPEPGSLRKSPSKPELGSLRRSPSKPELGNLTRSVTTNNLGALEKTAELKRRIVSPGRFERVKSILRGGKGAFDKAKTALPQPAAGVSQTPAPQVVEKALPAVPFTTPRRKLFKRVDFTPDTDRAIDAPNTVAHKAFSTISPGRKQGEVQYPNLDAVLGNVTQREESDGLYPDLTVESPTTKAAETSSVLPPTVPGTFTFRSDHTIRFASASPTGFGSTAGQSSVRHVRRSLDMPGSFPTSSDTLSNKENRSPMQLLAGKPHGMTHKKRARAKEEEGDLEEASGERAGKRRKAEPVPEGDALLAPRLMGATPNTIGKKPQTPRTFASPSPTKKRAGMSLSRLNMLAKPKMRN